MSVTLCFSSCTDDALRNEADQAFNPKYEMYYKLVSFYETMEGLPHTHPMITQRTNYSATEIRDYIEGVMNLVYTDPELTWESYEQKTDTFTIAILGGYATEEDVIALYEEMRDSASVFFYKISEPDKFPYLYDVEIIASYTSYIAISIEGIIGKVHRDPTPFGSSDYWSVFEEAGHCTPMSGGSGNASDQLNLALTDWYTPYGCGVWTNISNIPVADLEEFGWGDTNSNDQNPGDYILDYRTFYVECTSGAGCDALTNNGVFCLDPDEMNFYFQSIIGVYDDYIADSGLNLRMSTFGLFISYGSPYIYKWEGSNRFGNFEFCEEGNDFPFALPQCC